MRRTLQIVLLALSTSALAQSPGGHTGHGGMAAQGFVLPDDPRTAVEIPPDVRAFLRYEMRGHLEQLATLMARIGEGNFKQAAAFARSGLGVMGNHPPGAPNPAQFVPPEFRMMGQAMHRAANAVAEAGEAAVTPPSAADWKTMAAAAANLSAACAGCHGSFRLR
ncbi:MAG TPA: hypothetical protein PLQ11_00800 [Beijerinckiaceae bacterium]|nr:hypothetical protein [Beijerinckiaceae bacterium]